MRRAPHDRHSTFVKHAGDSPAAQSLPIAIREFATIFGVHTRAARVVLPSPMACSAYEYVKAYETDDRLLPGCWIVVRLDGKGFTKCASLPLAAAAAAAQPLPPALCAG